MILSGHQPVYLPGIILFNKIAISDAFMFVGQCQASPGTWHNRNQIRGARLTIPIKNDLGVSINDTEFVSDHWKRKHLRSIELAYRKAPYFDRYFDAIKKGIEEDEPLGMKNMNIIHNLCRWFEIDTDILDGRDFDIQNREDPNDMLIDMCRAAGADCYLSNEGSRDYVNENKLATAGIRHLWQEFKHPVYEQGQPFLANLSAIDILFNLGPDAGEIIKGCGRNGFFRTTH